MHNEGQYSLFSKKTNSHLLPELPLCIMRAHIHFLVWKLIPTRCHCCLFALWRLKKTHFSKLGVLSVLLFSLCMMNPYLECTYDTSHFKGQCWPQQSGYPNKSTIIINRVACLLFFIYVYGWEHSIFSARQAGKRIFSTKLIKPTNSLNMQLLCLVKQEIMKTTTVRNCSSAQKN